MQKKKKRFALLMCAAMACVALVGGTMAYLTYSDSDVNVMTLGNVSIDQHEYERATDTDGSYKTDTIDNVTSYVLQGFTQAKPLIPSAINTTTWEGWGWDTDTVVRMTQVDSYGYMSVFKAASNAQDKFVTVENTGKTDAYVRTLVAIEVGSTNGSLIGSSYHQTWTKNGVGTIEIDGNNYYVTEYVYAGGQLSDGSWRHENGILPAGDTSYPNLSQVYIKSSATNEDMEKIDGNGNGTLDILVLSQAVQSDGFENAQTALDTAFGKASEKAAEWFGGVKVPALVSTADELKAAIVNGEDVVLTSDITVDKWVMFSETKTIGNGNIITVKMDGLTIDGNGHTLTVKAVESAKNGDRLFDDASNLNIRNLTIDMECAGGAIGLKSGVIENVVFTDYISNCIFPGEGDITVKNCEFKNTKAQTIYYEAARDNLEIIDNTFNVDSEANVVILRGGETFTGNTVYSGRTVNIVSATADVTGNIFNTRVKLYQNGQKLSGNIFKENAYIDIEDGITVDVSGNYWGGSAPSSTQIPTAIKDKVVVKNYYTEINSDGELSNLLP